ncbi:MAG: HU family DNA-binding protein [Prevotellaceae bacterium]|jgi:DNA-binding protein HU-beta|nr:HU family DNA-binding protein [Prevotellaceae bacterium]
MNNKELIAELSKKLDISQKKVGSFMQAFVDVIGKNIVDENQTPFLSAGYFEQHQRLERTTISPTTKESYTVPAKKAVAFKSSAALKNHLKTLTV